VQCISQDVVGRNYLRSKIPFSQSFTNLFIIGLTCLLTGGGDSGQKPGRTGDVKCKGTGKEMLESKIFKVAGR